MNSISERATTRRTKEDRQPTYLAFAKVDGGWIRIGAAWNWRSGENGLSIQLSTLPLNFDGRFVLALPDREPPTGE
jgi:hypothetical protein